MYLSDIYLKPENYTTVLNIRAFGNLKSNLKPDSHDFTSDEIISELCLGAFAKFRKATISFVLSVRPSARNSSLDGFS